MKRSKVKNKYKLCQVVYDQIKSIVSLLSFSYSELKTSTKFTMYMNRIRPKIVWTWQIYLMLTLHQAICSIVLIFKLIVIDPSNSILTR